MTTALSSLSASDGTLAVVAGGTGRQTLTAHGLLIGNGSTAVTQLSAAAAGTLLTGQGASADPSFSATPTLGIAGTTAGKLSLTGVTSGTVTIQTANAAGTWSLTLPTTGGTNGYALTTNGSGVCTWTAVASGLTVGTTAIASGTNKRVLFDNSALLGESANFIWDTSNNFLSCSGISLANDVGTGIIEIWTTTAHAQARDATTYRGLVISASAGIKLGATATLGFSTYTGAADGDVYTSDVVLDRYAAGVLRVQDGSGNLRDIRLRDVYANDASFILRSATTITGGGTSNAPTLTAGPANGNPTKWLGYDDNGTTRYIPAW